MQYGFSKVRRGPETDMYAHPSFLRDQPERLSELRKLSSASVRRRRHQPAAAGAAAAPAAAAVNVVPPEGSETRNLAALAARSVSPSPPNSPARILPMNHYHHHQHPPRTGAIVTPPQVTHHQWVTSPAPPRIHHQLPLAPPQDPTAKGVTKQSYVPRSTPTRSPSRGRLDLLTLALEQTEELPAK